MKDKQKEHALCTNFIDPKVMQNNYNLDPCQMHGGLKDCDGYLHKTSFNLYDKNGNELTDENKYTVEIYFKCKCDKCGHEVFLPYDPDEPCVLY